MAKMAILTLNDLPVALNLSNISDYTIQDHLKYVKVVNFENWYSGVGQKMVFWHV